MYLCRRIVESLLRFVFLNPVFSKKPYALLLNPLQPPLRRCAAWSRLPISRHLILLLFKVFLEILLISVKIQSAVFVMCRLLCFATNRIFAIRELNSSRF